MVLCAAYRCSNRSGRDRVSFFRLPRAHPRVTYKDLINKRRNLWLRRLNRKFLNDSSLKNFRVCSKHFVTGKPSHVFDHLHPDWAPSINLGYDTKLKSATHVSLYDLDRIPLQKHQVSKLPVQSTNTDGAEISNNDSVDDSLPSKMNNSLAPGNAHIIRVVPITPENNKEIEQNAESNIEILQQQMEDSISKEGKESDISEKETESDILEEKETESDILEEEEIESDIFEEEKESDISEEEHYSLVKEEIPAKTPKTEVVTYPVCDGNRQLGDIHNFIPNLSQDNFRKVTEHLHLKEASKFSNMIQANPLISKVIEKKSRVPKVELKEKTDLVFKISVLESKKNRFQEQQKKYKKRINTLLKAQRQNAKIVNALKEYITVLKQKKDIAYANSEILKEASPSLLELLDRQNSQNKVKTLPNEYSLEVREFAKTLYSISPDAYRYVRNYFDMVLPHQRTILKWMPKENEGLVCNLKGVNEFNSANYIHDLDLIDEDDSIDSVSEIEINHVNGQ